jgi:transcriptional regulator with XRE-family HTH domain
VISENLKRMREEKGLSQAALAKAVGVSQGLIAQVERGTKTLTLPTAKAIVDKLGCSLEDLLSA